MHSHNFSKALHKWYLQSHRNNNMSSIDTNYDFILNPNSKNLIPVEDETTLKHDKKK